MKIAVEGCCHGHLDEIYSRIATLEVQHNYQVDVLLICGDFQAIRNMQDLTCMAVPDKYKALGGFHKYYSGETTAPILTIVIGGNHEASNYMWELYHGGWLAPNIYFLGHAGCVQVNGVRIAGASGIFKGNDFHQGHHEHVPYDGSSMRSIYHIREYNVRRMSLMSRPDIFLSHDWPAGIEHQGDLRGLIRRKPFFKSDIDKGQLGSPPLRELLKTLKPAWWFSAHLHVRFEAQVSHDGKTKDESQGQVVVTTVSGGINPDEIMIDDDEDAAPASTASPHAEPGTELQAEPQTEPIVETTTAPRVNPDEILLDDEEEEVELPAPPPPPPAAIVHTVPLSGTSSNTTRFLALDKCLPRREYLEVIDYPSPQSSSLGSSPTLTFDPEWLAIVRAFNPYLSRHKVQAAFPDEATARAAVTTELAWVQEHVLNGEPNRPIGTVQQFAITAPIGQGSLKKAPFYQNLQTEAFCTMLSMENRITP